MIRLLKYILEEIFLWFDFFLSYLPGRIGKKIRSFFIGCKVKKTGKNISVSTGVTITGYNNIEFGSNISIAKNSFLYAHEGLLKLSDNIAINSNSCIGASCGGEIIIGNNVLIAQNVVIRASDHKHNRLDIPINLQGHTGGRIIIKEGVWICANAVITRNLVIGEHSIVGAGAVVTKDVPPFSIVGGNPARLIKTRTEK